MILNFWCYMLDSVFTGNSLNTEAVMQTHEHDKTCLNCKMPLFPRFGVGMESIHLTCMARFPCHNNHGWGRTEVRAWVSFYRKVSTLLGDTTQELGPPEQCRCWCCGQWQPEPYQRAASNRVRGHGLQVPWGQTSPISMNAYSLNCRNPIPGRESAL